MKNFLLLLFCIIAGGGLLVWMWLELAGFVHPGYWNEYGWHPPGLVKAKDNE